MVRCVPGYGFVESRSRGAGGLASPGFSGTRPVKRNTKTCVGHKCVALVRWGSKLCLRRVSERVGFVCGTLATGFAE